MVWSLTRFAFAAWRARVRLARAQRRAQRAALLDTWFARSLALDLYYIVFSAWSEDSLLAACRRHAAVNAANAAWSAGVPDGEEALATHCARQWLRLAAAARAAPAARAPAPKPRRSHQRRR